MSITTDKDHGQICVWMSAGLLTYKLCDRELDCEGCPLDGALRCNPPRSLRRDLLLAPSNGAEMFPNDRRYSTGHSWVQPVDEQNQRLLRFGVDAFAAAIVGRCGNVMWNASQVAIARRKPICEIDLGIGVLTIGAPVRGVVLCGNRRLQDEPWLPVTSPYDEGWMVELIAEDPCELDGLLTAASAREKAHLDLRHFQRRVSHQLWADAGGVGATLPDGGQPIADLRQMLGGSAYMDLVRELVH